MALSNHSRPKSVLVARLFQRVDAGMPQLRTELLKQLGQRQNVFWQREESLLTLILKSEPAISFIAMTKSFAIPKTERTPSECTRTAASILSTAHASELANANESAGRKLASAHMNDLHPHSRCTIARGVLPKKMCRCHWLVRVFAAAEAMAMNC